jgi:hypothetical protein
MLDKTSDGRTDPVFDYLAAGHAANSVDKRRSWYLRPDSVLRKLCYDGHSIRLGRLSMADYLLGKPHC